MTTAPKTTKAAAKKAPTKSAQARELILKNPDWSNAQVARELTVSSTLVTHVVKTMKASGTAAEKKALEARESRVRPSSRRGLHAGAGGVKGQAIVRALEANPEWSRRQIAQEVGCTVGRVGEVVRWLAAAPKAEAPKAKTTAKKATATRAKKATAKG